MQLVVWMFEMARFYLWNACLIFQCVASVASSSLVDVRPSEVVRLRNGAIQGKTYTFEDRREATAFLGIPYAKAPVGKLRFKRPQPAGNWLDVKNASQFGNRCYYTTDQDYGIQPSEDCLFVNVFTPGSSFKKRELRPIAFYIHGGAFQTDNAALLGDENVCRYLALKDVIVVTFNYRLQFFGFLAIDENTPGNIGLWDMQAALEWVRDNAKSFGGDPNQITVFGQSAGSIATDLFTLSPHTNDLFNKAIMFSGNKYMFFSVANISTIRDNALQFAQTAGFQRKTGQSEKEENIRLLDFYQNADARQITIGWYPKKTNQVFLTSPTFDGDFFPKPLEVLRQEAPRIPTISGITEFEALLFLIGKPNDITIYNYTKLFLVNNYFSTPQINKTVADIIIHSFVDMSLPKDGLEFYKQCTILLSDFMFNYPTWKMVNRRTELGEKSYLYYFTYFEPGTLGHTKLVKFIAATHTLEIPYMFGKSVLTYGFTPNDADKAKIEEFTTVMTNFIKTGNPADKWLPYNLNDHNSYYLFGQNSTLDKMEQNFCGQRMLKWKKLYERFNIVN